MGLMGRTSNRWFRWGGGGGENPRAHRGSGGGWTEAFSPAAVRFLEGNGLNRAFRRRAPALLELQSGVMVTQGRGLLPEPRGEAVPHRRLPGFLAQRPCPPAGLSLVVGLVLYISSINDEVLNRTKDAETYFTYKYGWSFAFAAISFLLTEVNPSPQAGRGGALPREGAVEEATPTLDPPLPRP